MEYQSLVASTLEEFFAKLKSPPRAMVKWVPIAVAQSKGGFRQYPEMNSSGIYFFASRNKLQYLGRALPNTGLRNRIRTNARAFGNLKWDDVIKDQDALIGYLTLDGENEIWVASLELFLIAKLKPAFNLKQG